jgi:hypothetical protein
MVEGHRDVCAQLPLNLGGALRGQHAQRTIDMALKFDPMLLDSAQPLQGEHLETTRVGEHRAVPGGEPVQSTHRLHDVLARAEMQVVGVAQDDLGAGAADITRAEPADHGVSTDRHERRRSHVSMRQRESSRPGKPGRALEVELKHQEVEDRIRSIWARWTRS